MGDAARSQDLVPEVLGLLFDGDEQAAELTARLVLGGGTALVDLYDHLRSGVYLSTDLRAGREPVDERSIEGQELDQRLARLAVRLPVNRDGPQAPRVLIASTGRRGSAACLMHLFAEHGLPARALGLDVLTGYLQQPDETLAFPDVGHLVLDVGACPASSLVARLDGLRGPLGTDPPRDVVVLSDGAVNLPSALGWVTVVTTYADLLRATGAQPENPLTAREREVLREVALGSTNPQVAGALGISIGTVKTYLERAQDKTQARDRASTVATALRKGWI